MVFISVSFDPQQPGYRFASGMNSTCFAPLGALKLKVCGVMNIQYAICQDKVYVLEANPRYFEHRPKIDRIVFHVIADPMTRFLMLKSSQIDVSTLEPMQYERQLDKDFHQRFKTLELPSHSYTYLGFNLRLKKFQDPRVREALSLAIDRQSLIDLLFLGHGRVCTGPFLPGSKGFNDTLKPPKRNLPKASVGVYRSD